MTSTDRRIGVIINAGSGARHTAELAASIEERFRAAGSDADVVLVESGGEIASVVKGLIDRGARVVVAGGGDGSVNAVVAALDGHDVTLGVLPLGTLNHFARDLAIPLELDAAVAVIVAGHTTKVDLAEVNDHLFLNNSSLGLYAKVVEIRSRFQAHGMGKWIVAAWASFRVFRHNPTLGLRLTIDGEPELRRTPLVMVGNNAYRMQGFDAGSRESLSEGALAIYVVQRQRRWHLLRLVWRMLGRGDVAEHLEVIRAEAVTIEARHRRVLVTIDGELVQLRAPLNYRIRPLALTVLVPATKD